MQLVTKHPFAGDATKHQLSFEKGELLSISSPMNENQGWIWAKTMSSSSSQHRSGWCPVSYLEGIAPASADLPATPGGEEEDGFSGAIMGGSAPAGQPSREESVSFLNQNRSSSLHNAVSNVGCNLRHAGQRSMKAISSGAKKAGEHTQQAMRETKHRIQDLTAQQQEIKEKPPEQLTTGEQKAVDVGNYAARGAAAGAVASAVLNPHNMVGAASRGAIHGGVWGGAYGFVKDWEPFGKTPAPQPAAAPGAAPSAKEKKRSCKRWPSRR